jgi:hypothetical protein
MRLSVTWPDFVVFDDFLPSGQFKRVNKYVTKEAYLKQVDKTPEAAWNLDDGHPLQTPPILFQVNRGGEVRRQSRPNEAQYFTYPSGCAVDLLIAKLGESLRAYRRLIGAPGASWKHATATTYAYPPNTSLDWHTDGSVYKGAFTYYCHDYWKPQWGGELLIAEKKSPRGLGVYVLPTPNRLVVLRGGTAHKVAKVSLLAGEHFRLTVSGFFCCDDMPQAEKPNRVRE